MGRFNEILVGRYNRFAQKFFSMKGPASLVTLSDELMPVFPFFHGVENRYLESWNRYGIVFTLAAGGAGNFGSVRFRNPTGANVMAVFELIDVNSLLADQPFVMTGAITTDLVNINTTTNARLDPRGSPSPSLVVSNKNNATQDFFGATKLSCAIAANTTFKFITDINHEIPVLPGDALEVESNVANQALSVSILWRERFLEDSERT